MIIYKITNLINGKIYIGKDTHNNPKYYGSGVKISKAIKKYGKISFIKETLEICETNEQLNKQEIYWIDKLNSCNSQIGYNISRGGDGHDSKMAKEILNRPSVRKKLSISQTKRFKTIEAREKHKQSFSSLEFKKRHSDIIKKSFTKEVILKYTKKIKCINCGKMISKNVLNRHQQSELCISKFINISNNKLYDQKLECKYCGDIISYKAMKRHQQRKICKEKRNNSNE